VSLYLEVKARPELYLLKLKQKLYNGEERFLAWTLHPSLIFGL